MCISGNIGAKIKIPNNKLMPHEYLFGEDQSRYLIEVNEKNKNEVYKTLEKNSIFYEMLGKTQKDSLDLDKELEIILAKNKNLNNIKGKEKVSNMIKVANLTRKGFMAGDISSVMSPRTIIHWAENSEIFKDTGYAFRVTFLNKCDEIEKNMQNN